MNHVKTFYENDKKDLFDEYYVYKALDELIPRTENDFNNFKDPVIDKYNRNGYLIFVNNFYIYQPFGYPLNIPMYYRAVYDKNITDKIGLYEYIKYSDKSYKIETDMVVQQEQGYDFDSVMDYYSTRPEFDIVGIIDKEPNKKKLKSFEELEDVFKIRQKLRKGDIKKRHPNSITNRHLF